MAPKKQILPEASASRAPKKVPNLPATVPSGIAAASKPQPAPARKRPGVQTGAEHPSPSPTFSKQSQRSNLTPSSVTDERDNETKKATKRKQPSEGHGSDDEYIDEGPQTEDEDGGGVITRKTLNPSKSTKPKPAKVDNKPKKTTAAKKPTKKRRTEAQVEEEHEVEQPAMSIVQSRSMTTLPSTESRPPPDKTPSFPQTTSQTFARSVFSRKMQRKSLEHKKQAILGTADEDGNAPVALSAPLAPTRFRVHVSAMTEHRQTIIAAAESALKGYAYDRIVGDGEKETAVPYLYRQFNDRRIQPDAVVKLVDSFNTQGRLTWVYPIPLCVSAAHVDFSTLAHDTSDPTVIPVVKWSDLAIQGALDMPIAASGQHRKAAVQAIAKPLYAKVLAKRAEINKLAKDGGGKGNNKASDAKSQALRRARTELAVLEQEYIDTTVWTIAVYDTATIDAHPNSLEIYQYLSRNEVMFHLPATEREQWKTRLAEVGFTLKRKGVDFRTYMTTDEWKIDHEALMHTSKVRDALGRIMAIPEYMEMLLGLTEYGQHFVEWTHFDPKWWRDVLLDTFGMMFTELVEICEMPWRAILNSGDEPFDAETNKSRTDILQTTVDRDSAPYQDVMSLLLTVGFQPRSTPGSRGKSDAQEEPLAIHDFDVIDYTLYDDLADTYKTFFRPHALALLTSDTLTLEQEAAWESYKSSAIAAINTWVERARPHIYPSDKSLKSMLDKAVGVTSFLFENFRSLNMLRRVPFVNRFLLKDLRAIMSSCKEGLREVFRWVDGGIDIQISILNRNSVGDYSRAAAEAMDKAGVERDARKLFFSKVLEFCGVELRHLSAHLIDPKYGNMEDRRLKDKDAYGRYIEENSDDRPIRRLLGPAAHRRSTAYYFSSVVQDIISDSHISRRVSKQATKTEGKKKQTVVDLFASDDTKGDESLDEDGFANDFHDIV
ncbi:hypothetical protein BV25DRAFT_1842114 [Artomyces pyxidatus]|uniref:Uncharacterized protein n=1 Tax=Artomyces pyxidatus TaxID=48021 RepID=A0ACB8SLD7_9AGAM|nr:hypothetical protein BV25DRAFT_1842114 [Artomyces pyxidatus]